MGHTYTYPFTSQYEQGCVARPGLDYYGQSRAVRELSGDFFTFAPAGGGGLTAAIGEITGGGISAPILRLGVRSVVVDDIVEVAEHLNRMVCEIAADDSFAALFYARVDAEHRRLEYVSAGHEPALLVRDGGQRVHRLGRTGTMLGLTDRSRYRRNAVVVEPGDVLLAFSDGIGEEEAARVARRYPDARARDLVGEILEMGSEGEDLSAIAIRLTAAEHRWDPVACMEEMAAA